MAQTITHHQLCYMVSFTAYCYRQFYWVTALIFLAFQLIKKAELKGGFIYSAATGNAFGYEH